MNGSKLIAEPIVIADRALVEDLITVPVAASGRVEIRAGASSRSRVLVDYDRPQDWHTTQFEIEFTLESGACADVFHVMSSGAARGDVTCKIRYHLKKHASLNVWTYVDGGDRSRVEHHVRFEEEHGFASLRGLSILSGDSQAYHTVNATHQAGHCISRQFYKSIVADKARSGFDSLVSVGKNAVRSDSKQLNKNLVLSREARCYSRPELRIQNDDVSAAHGSATGELNPAELFYLRSRGISKDAARLVMIDGFAAAVLHEVSYPPLKEKLQGFARAKIDKLTVGP